jgi:hypothetical protein
MLTVVCAYTQCKQEHTCIHTLQWLHPICGIHIQGNLRIFNHKMYANILYKMISAWLGRLITLKWKHFLVACTWSKPSPTGTEPKKPSRLQKKWSNNLCYYIACCSLSESNRKDHRASTHFFLEFNVAKKEILNSQMAPLSTPYRHLHTRAVLLIVARIVAGILGVLNTDITPKNLQADYGPHSIGSSVFRHFFKVCVC